MKKGRISKKTPNRILKAIESRVSPGKEFSNPSKQLINSLHFQQIRRSQKLHLPQYHSNTFRYRVVQQSLDFQKRKQGYSPRFFLGSRSLEKSSQETASYRKNRAVLQEMAHRYKNKSPYLEKNADHKSDRKLIIGNRNFTQSSRGLSKQMKTVRFNSLQEKSESPDSKKGNASQDILKEAKKLMVAGQSRKSLFILKPLLAKEPQNLSAYHMAAINLYNIGDYKKTGEYLDHIIEISKEYSPNIYILRGKAYLKQKKFDDCLLKLEECRNLFPECEALYLELGDFYTGLKRYKSALSFYEEAEKLAPQSIKIQQKLLSVLQHLLQYQRILKIIDKLAIFGNPEKYSSLKSKCLIKLSRFSQLISSYKNIPGSITSLSYAYCLYKTKDPLKSYLILDSNLHQQENKKDSIRLMLLILCSSNDFYQGYHLLQRCQHLNINRDQLKCEISFIDGAIYLMKKNILQGVKSFTNAQQLLQNYTKGEDVLSIQNELNNYMRKSVNMFLGYGYLCLGNYKKSLSLYKLQMQKYKVSKSDGLQYNMLLNEGYFYYESKDIKRSKQIFQSLTKLNSSKIQPYICLAILNINLYFSERQEKRLQNIILLQSAKQLLKTHALNAVSLQNNLGAIFFYHKSVLHAYMAEWREALASVDEAIEKSEENYWRYYYLRATILASIHNFAEAINDCTAAINLKDSEPSPFLLRSICFQIEGQGNYAFKDLQSYIGLKPEDKGIHKYAGKLLFENGAFEDALGAFNHQMVEEIIENEDVFLTKSKTYFLLGRFQQASIEMDIVSKINPQRKYAEFDSKMMKVLDTLLRNQNYRQLTLAIDSIYQEHKSAFVKWQIFKKTEQHTLKSVCYFYEGQYNKTIQQLQRAISVKQKTILKQSLIDGSTRQDQKDTLLYTNQMKFNISLCYLMLGDLQRATDQAGLMCFYSNDPFHQPYRRYMGILLAKKTINDTQQIKVEIFPNRNKISNFLKEVRITVHGQKIKTKLCIPFPKVEPPQIFPKFDETLLEKFSILKIQRKPEAPWICRQNNTIKFTNKIQKYSRLEIEESVGSITEKDIDNSHISADSVIERRKNSRKSMPKLLENEDNSKFL